MNLDVPADPSGQRRLSPTDVSHFIRQASCQRFLRLTLLERVRGRNVLKGYGVTDQGLTPLLTNTGLEFEHRVEQAISGMIPARRLGEDRRVRSSDTDNDELARTAIRLPSGARTVLFQTRLRARLGAWDLRGDADLILFERSEQGKLSILVADIKSSTAPRLEHQLQVAFYAEMIAAVLADSGVDVDRLDLGVIYRASEPDRLALDADLAEQVAHDRRVARQAFGADFACLALVERADALRDTIADLVSSPGSTAERVATLPFADVPYHLQDICDGCRFNEFCMKWSAEHDDLSLIPFLTAVEKGQLIAAGVRTTTDLANLKRLEENGPDPSGRRPRYRLVIEPGREATVRALASRSPVGGRLDELIYRAHSYRRGQGDDRTSLGWVPGGGKGTLPLVDADHHSNLVWVYLDAQKDYVNDRLYLLAARVVACEHGKPVRQESIIEMTTEPPDDPLTERGLVQTFVSRVVTAVSTLAAPNPENGTRSAPIHLVFFSGVEMGDLLDGLSRHLREVFGATALYDFVTQPPAYDSPLITQLASDIRQRRNLPLIAQSLQRTAGYYGFNWNEPRPFRELFRDRMFDFVGRFHGADGEEGAWYTRRARFRSGIPLEYAYGVWGKLEASGGNYAAIEPYLRPSREEFLAFADRRLDALVHVADRLGPNRDAGKGAFALPDLATFESKATGLGEALLEFLQIERHVTMAEWRRIRQIEPERRMAMGHGWVASFHDADQDPEAREALVMARDRFDRRQALAAERKATGGDLTKEEKKDTTWSLDGLPLRLRVELEGDAETFRELLALNDLHDGDRAVMWARYTVDSRLPKAEQVPMTVTPKALLYGARVGIESIAPTETADGGASGQIQIDLLDRQGGTSANGYAFGGHAEPPRDGETYTLDPSPDDHYGNMQFQTIDQIVHKGRQNTVFERLAGDTPIAIDWPHEAAAGQRRFMDGLDALEAAGHLHQFESSKHAFIADNGAEPFLLVQGPPGTGKSYTTAFALFARIQGAMAAGRPYRVAAGCKTHAATDVLRDNVLDVRCLIASWRDKRPDIFARYFDPRLIDVPILRAHPRERPPDGIGAIWGKADRTNEAILPGDRIGVKSLERDDYLFVFAPPAGIRHLDEPQARNKGQKRPIHCLVLDEASQMNLPEAIMMGRLLDRAGQVIVVGDHRQMAPIVSHDWEGERRRTFQEYAAYRSLFDTLRTRSPSPAMIRFEESFRLHADMARFLRDEIYIHDDIDYHSRKTALLSQSPDTDAFVAAVLDPAHPLTVVTHDEQDSQTCNDFEVELMTPVLLELSSVMGLDAEEGLGVVVPHRAQRAAFLRAVPELEMMTSSGKLLSAVDTVERFQGGERTAMVFAATESDPGYLSSRADFLYDPRRLTVAMSRAKRKMVLVASESVFRHFSPDEETFANVLLWKNLLRRTCTVPVWTGTIAGRAVTVWGNPTQPTDGDLKASLVLQAAGEDRQEERE